MLPKRGGRSSVNNKKQAACTMPLSKAALRSTQIYRAQFKAYLILKLLNKDRVKSHFFS